MTLNIAFTTGSGKPGSKEIGDLTKGDLIKTQSGNKALFEKLNTKTMTIIYIDGPKTGKQYNEPYENFKTYVGLRGTISNTTAVKKGVSKPKPNLIVKTNINTNRNKMLWELVEGDIIELTDGSRMVFIKSNRTKFTAKKPEDVGTSRYYNVPKSWYKSFTGEVSKAALQIKADLDSAKLSISVLKPGDLFGYYQGGKLKNDAYMFKRANGAKYEGICLTTGRITNFASTFQVIKIDIQQMAKDNL